MSVKFGRTFGFLRSAFLACIPCVSAFHDVGLQMFQLQDQLRNTELASEYTDSPGILVIAADHGEGTSGLSHALGAHPCFISVGEPFNTASQRWFSPTGEKAFFKDSDKRGDASKYTKLQEHLDDALKVKGYEAFKLSNNLERKHPNLHDFFQAVRGEVCHHVDLPSVCGSRCVLVHKLFPSWFTYNFSHVEDYLRSGDTMVLQVFREEAAVINSNAERFGPMSETAVEGHEKWDSFLNALQSELSSAKVWTNISMDSDIFRSPEHYFDVVRDLLSQFDVPTDEASLMPIQEEIVEQFHQYAEKKVKLANRNESEPFWAW